MATPAAMTADTIPSATRERLVVLATRAAAASMSFHIWAIWLRVIPDLGSGPRDCAAESGCYCGNSEILMLVMRC